MIPRGHLTLTGFNIKSDEFANPNVWLRMVVENDVEIRKVLAKVRAVPITVNYDLEILLSSEIDTFKCSQAVMDTLWLYKFMYFEYNFLNIDAVILMPDSNQIEMSREKNLTSDNNIKMKVSFTVETYYPAFRSDRVNAIGTPQYYGSGMSYQAGDLNQFAFSGGYSEFFNQPNGGAPNGSGVNNGGSPGRNNGNAAGGSSNSGSAPGSLNAPVNQTPYGQTGSFYNTQGASSPTNPYGSTTNSDYLIVGPKRTRWFNNILRAREKASGNINNPNGSIDPIQNSNNQNPSNGT